MYNDQMCFGVMIFSQFRIFYRMLHRNTYYVDLVSYTKPIVSRKDVISQSLSEVELVEHSRGYDRLRKMERCSTRKSKWETCMYYLFLTK